MTVPLQILQAGYAFAARPLAAEAGSPEQLHRSSGSAGYAPGRCAGPCHRRVPFDEQPEHGDVHMPDLSDELAVADVHTG